MKKSKNFLAGMITMLLIVSLVTTAHAANTSKAVELFYRDIKITLNGTEIVPKNADGDVVEPFIIAGTTYLPVRAIGEALGLNVDWDGTTSTVVLTNGGSTKEIVLSAGNYFAGKDFPAGTYDIIAVSGGGNVQSSNMFNGGINAIMGDDSYIAEYGDMYQKEYKNIRLPDGTELRLIGGITVKLVPKS